MLEQNDRHDVADIGRGAVIGGVLGFVLATVLVTMSVLAADGGAGSIGAGLLVGAFGGIGFGAMLGATLAADRQTRSRRTDT